MGDRIYRGVFGLTVLVGLYFELNTLIVGLVFITLFEGVSDLRIPIIVRRFYPRVLANWDDDPALGLNFKQRFSLSAEQVFRLTMGVSLGASFFVFPTELWFIAWFIGFTTIGAGASGVCPMYLTLRWLGFSKG